MVDYTTTKDVGDGKSKVKNDYSELLQVFIDNGHSTIKCMKVNNFDMTQDLPHFEIPMMLLPEINDHFYQQKNKYNSFHKDNIIEAEKAIL